MRDNSKHIEAHWICNDKTGPSFPTVTLPRLRKEI